MAEVGGSSQQLCEACVAQMARVGTRHEIQTQTDGDLNPGPSMNEGVSVEFNLCDEYQDDELDLEGGDLQGPTIAPNESSDEMEYEYEPGIALSSLEFAREASILSESQCILCGLDYETDLQLAAELGKTLLEKNKDLETSLKRQQIIIDDQAQEIEYLSKQQFAYREASDRQVKIYEQLEESISDLEKANKKLVEENNNDKQHIKSLMSTVDCLESRCEELQRQLDQIRSEELHSLESSANDSNQGQSLTKPLGRRRKDRRKSSSIVECLLSSEKWKRTDSEFHLILPTFIRRSSEDDPHGSHSSDDPNPSSLTHSESNGDEDDEDESHDRLGEEISTGDLFEFFQPPSSSGYSSSSIDSHHHSEHSDNDNSEQTLTTTLAKELKAATTPALSEQHSSLPTTDLSSMELHHDLQLISELNLLRAKYDEVLERAKELEIIISKLQVENEALKTSEQEGEPPGSGLSHEDLNGIEHDGLFESHVAGNVREEVDNVEVVRSGKMCGNCLGPMDEHPPGELLAQAAKQVAMTIQSEDALTLTPPDQCPINHPNPQPFRLGVAGETHVLPLLRASSLPPIGSSPSPISLQEELLMSGEPTFPDQTPIPPPIPSETVARRSGFEADDENQPRRHVETQTNTLEFLRSLQVLASKGRSDEPGQHPFVNTVSLKDPKPVMALIDGSFIPSLANSKTNYKEIFKEIFQVLSQARHD